MLKEKGANVKGFILIEVLVSLAIFVLFAGAMVSMILGSLTILEKSGDYAYAANLSHEGLEAVKSVQARAWNELIFSKSSVDFDNQWFLSGENTEAVIDKFNRQIIFTPLFRDLNGNIVLAESDEAVLDINSLYARSLISWKNNKTELSLSNQIIITNWESRAWEQSSWDGGAEQVIVEDLNSYFTQENIFTSDYLKLENMSTTTLFTSGYLESSAFGPIKTGVFSVLMWQELIPSDCISCRIKVQIKTAPDNGGSPGTWSNTWSGPEGADDDESDYFENGDGALIANIHNGDKWIKYRILIEGDGEKTPELHSFKIYYK